MNNPLKKQIINPLVCYLGRRKERKHFSRAPIFVGGCARSGTSLLLAILSAHPKICCLPKETDAFTEWEEKNAVLRPVRMDRMYRELLKIRVPEQAHRWCEKRPYNVLYIAEILRYFGSEARFIHIVRDPRSVCTSVHPERTEAYWVTPERYVRDTSAGLKYREHPQVLTIRYEDLVADPDKIISRLCEFTGEAYCPEISHWYEHATVRSNRAWFGSLSPLHTSSLEKWKTPEHHARVEEIMRNEQVKRFMVRLGYE